ERLNANLFERLLHIDETGILECYYNRPGKQTWVGEYTGKYLHAASRVWRSTKNPQLKEQMDRIVDILISCQNDDGYLGTYLPANYWTDWDAWAHKYNILGLLSYYSVTGYKPALEACVKMGDLLCRTFGEKPGQRRIIDNSPHMGMASTSVLEPMTCLYRFTGNKKYLDFCNYIIKSYEMENGPKIISTLTSIGKVDKTGNGKAYEMMSNLTGIVKLYQLTGNEKLLKATENAWNDISRNKLYITGTASKGEMFQEDSILPAGNDVHMGEGCVTTTWLQFSQALYYLTGEPKYINEIEKTIYNHLLAAENPETGCVSYYTALQGKKPYRCNIDGHCCLASVPRGIAAIPELAYSKNAGNGFCINLYSTGRLAGEIFTKEGNEVAVQCNIQSTFPEGGKSTITINPVKSCEFKLSLHVPDWCKNYKAVVNGKTLVGIPGQYLNIEQSWEKNSVIQVSFDMTIQKLDGGLSYPGYMAFKYGAQVLAVDQALNPEIRDLDQLSVGSPELAPLPKTTIPSGWIGDQIYKTKAFYDGKPVVINLVPYADASQTGGDIRVWIKKK
ncbi:MAG TPA: beta-L-arabinofuranosidase domain-containing protein, partial [Methylococcales bacterium]